MGEYTGYVYYLENIGENNAPVFATSEKFLLENGNPLQYNASYPRSRVFVTDWNEDGFDDLLVGGNDGKIQLYTSVAPEPVSSTLFIVGSGVLGFKGLRRKYKKN